MPAWLRRSGVAVACLTAFATPLSTAAGSIGKVLMLIFALLFLLWPHDARTYRRLQLPSIALILALLAWCTASIGWTVADVPRAVADVAKYGKLILIPTLMILLATRREALLALGCLGVAQTFVLLSSVLLYAGLDLPWVRDQHRLSVGSVYFEYITQSIMMATFAALCWVLRDALPGPRRVGRLLAIGLALLALLDTLYLLPGRTGWAVAAALAALLAWWELPRRFRVAALLTPPLVVALLLATSDTGRVRLHEIVTETQQFAQHGVQDTSSGERLNFWRRSLQSAVQAPWLGSGVGSWQTRYLELEQGAPPESTRKTRNPHNEYLLVAVQTGVVGLVLLLAWMGATWRDAWRRFDEPAARAVAVLIASLAVASLFNSALFDSTKGSFYCIVTGVLFAYGSSRRDAAPGAA